MPVLYVASHLTLSARLAGITYWLAIQSDRRRLRSAFVLAVLAVVAAAALAERRTEWMALATATGWPDVVYFTNLALEGMAVVLALLWRQARERGGRWDLVRAGLLSVVALGAALYSHAWLFRPVPAGLGGKVDAAGLCKQTTPASCSAAAAATLLHAHGLRTNEAEMAALCLTREQGTATLGLYRGLALRGRELGLRPRIRHVSRPDAPDAVERLADLRTPAIISVGLAGNPPPELRERLEGYGWQQGVRHAVVVLSADPKAGSLDVADPSNGREKWPVKKPEDLAYIWDGWAIVMERR